MWSMAAGPAMGAIGQGLSSMFSQSPYEAAAKQMQNLKGEISPYLNPYINSGKNSMSTLEQQYQQMLQNPQQLLASLGQGYQQSPGYQNQMDQSMSAIMSAMGAGGQLGGTAHQYQAGQMAGDIANQDYQNWLSQVLGLYGGGITGNQGMMNQGYNAANSMSDYLSQNLANQAELAAMQGQNQQQGLGSLLGGLGGSGGSGGMSGLSSLFSF